MASESHWGSGRNEARLPRFVLPLVVAFVVLPFAWYLFGPTESLIALSANALSPTTAMYVHGLLEWTTACAAITTSFLAFAHFAATRSNPTMALIAPVFLFAGLLDGFHALASIDLAAVVAPPQTLIPATWALGRWYVGLALAISPVLALRDAQKSGSPQSIQMLFNAVLGVATAGLMYLATQLPHLPDALFPHAAIRRPSDLVGLVFFAVAAIYSLPRFYERFPSMLAHALMLSMVPQVAAQAFMAFGSGQLYDAAFFWAHGMKMFAYLLPFFGIALDYVHGQLAEERAVRQAEKARLALIEQVKDLTAQHAARQDAEEGLLKHMARANLHTRIAIAANQAMTFSQSLEELMREICEYTGWIAGHVFVNEGGPAPRLVATNCWYAQNPRLLEPLRAETERLALEKGQCAAGRAWELAAPVWQVLGDPARFSRPPAALPAGVQAVIAFPAMVGDRVVGVLEFFSLDKESLSQDLIETMTHVGVQFGRVFERNPWRIGSASGVVPSQAMA
jgi:hypothetical protein